MASHVEAAMLIQNDEFPNKRAKTEVGGSACVDAAEPSLLYYCLPTDLTREISEYCSLELAVRFSLTSKSIRDDITSSTRKKFLECDLTSDALQQFAAFQRLQFDPPTYYNDRKSLHDVSAVLAIKAAIMRAPVNELQLGHSPVVSRVLDRKLWSRNELDTWDRNLRNVKVLKTGDSPIPPLLLEPCLTRSLRVIRVSVVTISPLAEQLVASCSNLQHISVSSKQHFDWMKTMKLFQGLKSLMYASLDGGRQHWGLKTDRQLKQFDFLADTRQYEIFRHVPEKVAFRMLQRTIKKFGPAAARSLVDEAMLRYFNTPVMALRAFRAGIDASMLLTLGSSNDSWLCPMWLYLVAVASDASEMIRFLFNYKSISHPVSGELCSIIDEIKARYGCMPSVHHVWHALLFPIRCRYFRYHLPWSRVCGLLMDNQTFPDPDTINNLLLKDFENFEHFEDIILHPSFPVGQELNENIASTLLRNIKRFRELNIREETVRRWVQWLLKHKLPTFSIHSWADVLSAYLKCCSSTQQQASAESDDMADLYVAL